MTRPETAIIVHHPRGMVLTCTTVVRGDGTMREDECGTGARWVWAEDIDGDQMSAKWDGSAYCDEHCPDENGSRSVDYGPCIHGPGDPSRCGHPDCGGATGNGRSTDV